MMLGGFFPPEKTRRMLWGAFSTEKTRGMMWGSFFQLQDQGDAVGKVGGPAGLQEQVYIYIPVYIQSISSHI